MQFINNHVGDMGALSARYEYMCSERNLNQHASRHWRTGTRPTTHDPLYSVSDGNNATYIYETQNGALVKLWSDGDHILAVAAAGTEALARQVIVSLSSQYPEVVISDPNSTTVNFWTRTNQGPSVTQREILVPAWSEIAPNYPSNIRKRLKFLMHDYKANPEGGKLVLWTGPPGTGKTYALRALAREWRHWCELHYIIDPEAFYSGPADYLFQVALANRGQDYDWDFEDEKRTPRPTWRLIVCEDTGELLSADAKDRTGTALARFLNLCDGMVGQGLRVQILITTNEEIQTFHKAVIRPGRAASQIRFDKFSADEAALWLGRDPKFPSAKQLTLAELYAIQRGENLNNVLDRPDAGFLAS